MADRYLISGGGTGGGVYPALAVVGALRTLRPGAEVLWVGSTHGVERELVTRAGLPFEGVPAGPLVGVGLRALPHALRILAGTVRALGIVGRFRPQALLITGGWATIPAALACWLRGVPVVIDLPDVEPGSTIRALARIARRVAVTAPDSLVFFRSGQAVETGYPVRADLLHAAGFDVLGRPLPEPPVARVMARERFGLRDEWPTLLVLGGSRGARSINQALAAALPAVLEYGQVIHLTGSLDYEQAVRRAAALPGEAAARYHCFEYLHGEDMALALAAADVAVSRAGASTLGEFPLFGLPAILVPYPHAWRYQKTNADYLVTRGAAVRLDDDQLTDHLSPLAGQLLLDSARRRQMAAAAHALKRPDAAARIAALLIQVVRPSPGARAESAPGVPMESRG